MSDVFDVTSVTIEGDTSTTFTFDGIESVVITDATSVPDVTLQVPEEIDAVTLEVPGMQGPPGDQNIFPQPNSPADEYGWGPEDAYKIWIEVNI